MTIKNIIWSVIDGHSDVQYWEVISRYFMVFFFLVGHNFTNVCI